MTGKLVDKLENVFGNLDENWMIDFLDD
jgi:hypothetical protein